MSLIVIHLARMTLLMLIPALLSAKILFKKKEEKDDLGNYAPIVTIRIPSCPNNIPLSTSIITVNKGMVFYCHSNGTITLGEIDHGHTNTKITRSKSVV